MAINVYLQRPEQFSQIRVRKGRNGILKIDLPHDIALEQGDTLTITVNVRFTS